MYTYKFFVKGELILETRNVYSLSKKIALFASNKVARACDGKSLHKLFHGIYDLPNGIKIQKIKQGIND